MNATEKLHEQGQSLWLDNITRELLTSGTLHRYIDGFSITGLTSNPTIFHKAIKDSNAYDAAIRKLAEQGKSGEDLFFELAIEDLTQAADLLRPIFDRTCGVDGWVSLEVSPLLAHDTETTIAVAKDLYARAGRPNLFIKIPGTKEGLPAIEEAIFAGVPINVTLLFSREHYVASADAYLRGIERRIAAGLTPDVASVASMFISRWDVAVKGDVPDELSNELGIAIGKRTYKTYCDLMASPRWQRAFNRGTRPQRLLMASTGTKDPQASDVLYIEGLAAPLTINTMPEGTLKAFADSGEIGAVLATDGGDCEDVLAKFANADIDIDALAARLQDEGAASFVKSWNELIKVIASKTAALATTSLTRHGTDSRTPGSQARGGVMNVLVVDVGGSHVKILATGQDEPRKFSSGPRMTAEEMVSGVKELVEGWEYDVVSIGYPGAALRDRVVSEPHNLGKGWVGFDFESAFECPVKLINDAAMQALGSYQGGKLLFLGLGTGLGSAMVVDGIVEPMELGHLPYKKDTYEDYVSDDSLERRGKKKWRKHVAKVVAYLTDALQPNDVVLGGGNVSELEELPPGCRVGDNANAFLGGFRMWEDASGRDPSPRRSRSLPTKQPHSSNHGDPRMKTDSPTQLSNGARTCP